MQQASIAFSVAKSAYLSLFSIYLHYTREAEFNVCMHVISGWVLTHWGPSQFITQASAYDAIYAFNANELPVAFRDARCQVTGFLYQVNDYLAS